MASLLLRSAIVPAVLAVAAFASADVAFSNFSSTAPGYSPAGGINIVGPSGMLGLQYRAQQFTSGLTGTLTSLEVAIGHTMGTGSVQFEVFADGVNGPGTALASFTETFTTSGIYTANVPGNVALNSGGKYWVGVKPLGDTWKTWHFNNLFTLAGMGPAMSNYAEASPFYDPSALQGALRVNATPSAVPEPATMAALGLGALALLRRRKRA